MKIIYYSVTIALSLFIIVSCSTESTPIYQLTTSVEPTEAGTVSPASGEYEEGEEVSITATSNEHWVFDSWQGGHSGRTNPATVTMDSDKNITALFIKRDYPLTVNTEGEGTVSERVVQAKTTDYPHGTTVELTANPADGWVFTKWGENLEGSDNPASITVEDETSVTSVFKSIDDLLSVIVEGEGTVEIDQESANENPSRTQVELTASATEGWEFVEWLGDIDGTENQTTLTIDSEKNIKAVFEKIEYTVNTSVEGEGIIKINPEQNVYYHGDEINITVEPSEGWNFVHWDGDLEGTDNPYSLTLESDVSATAHLDESLFAGGNGSELYPYQVSTIEQLQEIRNYTDKHYVQINDIDVSATLNWNEGKGFRPIGDDIVQFIGSFDGGGYKISDLNINREDENNVGLFGFIGRDGVVANIEMIDIKVIGSTHVGGLAGYSYGEIENVTVHGSIHGNGMVGGLIGYQRYNNIISSGSYGSVEGSGSTGGLIGYARSSTVIIKSFSRTNVKGGSASGGLIGRNGAIVKESFASGNIEGNNEIGGLIGTNTFAGEVLGSFANGNVIGQEKVGGLLGSNGQTFSNFVTNSYATGDVNGVKMAGGLIGVNGSEGEVVKSYSVGQVTGNNDIGGSIGVNGGSISADYWDLESTDQSDGVGRGSSNGVTELTTNEMQGTSAQENMPEFDWNNIWITTTEYPILRWQEE